MTEKEQAILDQIGKLGVVPVLAVDSVEAALPLADALLEGGLPIAEITFRTEAAAEVIAKITDQRPELFVGAGTVLNETNLQRAIDCGARFAVAPGLNPAVVSAARATDFPFMPGVATPTDIETAVALGCRALKFFPAGALGGVSMLKSIAAPYLHLGLRFMPTGGVNIENLTSYLEYAPIIAAGGTWIAKPDDLAAGRWNEIRDRCKKACEIVATIVR
jgi:2-dehydro-3-deoxyphosphogluconate aldolase / (4S)-4-hydroxy-2-oxoglutarate aldolase